MNSLCYLGSKPAANILSLDNIILLRVFINDFYFILPLLHVLCQRFFCVLQSVKRHPAHPSQQLLRLFLYFLICKTMSAINITVTKVVITIVQIFLTIICHIGASPYFNETATVKFSDAYLSFRNNNHNIPIKTKMANTDATLQGAPETNIPN